jgi:hypothetical protein
MESLKKVLGGIGTLVIVLVVAAVGRQVVQSSFSDHSPSANDQQIVEQLQQASNEVNKQLPKMYDKVTRLDTTIAGPSKTWVYMYTIVSPNSPSLTQQDLDKYLGKEVRNGVCTADFMKVFINNGVQVKYVYRANDGKFIGSIVVNPSDCKPST